MVARVKITISGGMGTSERWSTGIHFGFGTPLSNANAQAVANSIRDKFALTTGNPLGSLTNLISSVGTITDIDVYQYGASGGAIAAGTAQGSPIKAGSGTPQCPPQTAGVFTLLTGNPGASGRGRIYWPATNPTMSNTFKSAAVQAARNDVVAMLAAMQASLVEFGAYLPVVYSPKNDTITAVSAVRAGDVLDTQRRRRDTLPEVYATSQYPT